MFVQINKYEYVNINSIIKISYRQEEDSKEYPIEIIIDNRIITNISKINKNESIAVHKNYIRDFVQKTGIEKYGI